MPNTNMVSIDGNAAAAHVAHATNEVIAIYPITPSSPMGELADEFSSQGRKNIWGTIPHVIEMQSEGGAAGAVHGALTTGALTTTFTASQGLLLMIPNMYKIAGELTPTVFHIAARALAAQALSIFGDHSDVMATRATGFAMLASNSVQEVMDLALVAQAATLETRIPFLHFFDGFRTSHEVQKISEIPYDVMRAMIRDDLVAAHRARALNPERPVIRGTSQNPDVYFAARETVNKFYETTPAIVQSVMDRLASLVGRKYHLFDYVGAADAERVLIIMGSGAETVDETVEFLGSRGEKVGLIKVRLYRPFDAKTFVRTLPASVKAVAVLDRTKEPGSLGEPLYEDVRTALTEAFAAGGTQFRQLPLIIGGRYGLGSNEFNPGMVKAVFDNLAAAKPKNHFTVGIEDDITGTSLPWDNDFTTFDSEYHRALFYGLGSDGTVSANKNSIKMIGDETENYAQGYFVYDSKKAGATTVSHLRFGKRPIRSAYLIQKANFLACHKFSYIEKLDMLSKLETGGTFLLNSPFGKDQIWAELPREVQDALIHKKARFYVIDAQKIADAVGMKNRINVVMQTAFFNISGVLPEDEAVRLIKQAVKKSYGKKGQEVVEKNIDAIDRTIAAIEKVSVPTAATSNRKMIPSVPETAPQFVREVIGEMIAMRGESIPVGKLPADGTYPLGTTRYEKRNIAETIPVWDPEICIQCGDCSAVCPHATIRIKAYAPKYLEGAPATFKSTEAKGRELAGLKYTIQVAPEDCTGCSACLEICPAFKRVDGQKTDIRAISMQPQPPLRETEATNWDFFKTIPNTDPALFNRATVKGSQFLEPLFEFSGACAGCGETPYVKLLSQLFGDRAIIANATGCSSIYGGNLPTTPYATRADGRGPAWSNSLFEDAAEFGLGMRLTSDKLREYALELIDRILAHTNNGAKGVDPAILQKIRANPQSTPEEIEQQRAWIAAAKTQCAGSSFPEATSLASVADYLVKRSVWILGGDGWAYDIGFGGLDHVLATGRNVNVLVMDTEIYSNTGGQMSKATPIGAIAKFAAGGKSLKKKDLGLMAMSYGYVYVARVAMGANRLQTIRAFMEAEAYPGPSIIIAYSHCLNHGIDMAKGMDQQKAAVTSGMWPLYRFNPTISDDGKNPLTLDSKEASTEVEEYIYKEIRYRSLRQSRPEEAERLLAQAKKNVKEQYDMYRHLAERT